MPKFIYATVMGNLQTTVNLADLKGRALSGKNDDVDFLMGLLDSNNSIVTCKMVDFALGQVSSPEGRIRIEFYLYNGSPIQRNYACIYFKRMGLTELVLDAAIKGYVDENIALSK